jgi:hypothetical protein
MPVERERIEHQDMPKLPFGYYLQRDADLLVLRRADGSLVAAFSVRGFDPLEVELALWEDAD